MPISLNLTVLIGFILTLSVYGLFFLVSVKIKAMWANPMILSMLAIPVILLTAQIPFSDYEQGSKLISYFIGPATIALAVPVVRQLPTLKRYRGAIVVGGITGTIAAFISNFFISLWFHLPKELILAIAPKSITTPFAVEVARSMEGDPSLTTGMVVFTGIFGLITARYLLNFLRIYDPISRGLAMGVSFHAIGIVRARQEGEVTGAISSIAIALAGVITTLATPFLYPWFRTFMN